MDTIKNWGSRQEIANRLFELRNCGNIDDAISLTVEAMNVFTDDYFYPKIAGDLFYQKQDYNKAANYWLIFLIKLTNQKKMFGDFARRYYKLKKVLTKEEIGKFSSSIVREIDKNNISHIVADRCINLIKDDLTEDSSYSDVEPLIRVLDDDRYFNECVKLIKAIESNKPIAIEMLLDKHVLNRERTVNTYRIDSYCVAFYERKERYDSAIKIAEELLNVKIDSVVLRSLFRNCRRQEDFSKIESILAKYPDVLTTRNFNILYELVYYFEAKNDFENVKATLFKMEKTGLDSTPIQKTVRNFYIRFGLIDDAKRVSSNISKLDKGAIKGARFADEVSESEEVLASTVVDLHSKLEHQMQLAAISDLTTGISHELGQPITNIRYTIQFYRRILKDPINLEQINNVFNSILEETQRMGGLIKRLSPLTSSRKVIEPFDIIERIKIRVKAEEARFARMKNLEVTIKPQDKSITIIGDPVKFDQLITNLLLNAIDGIQEKRPHKKRIWINVSDEGKSIQIQFSDNGVGIPIKYRTKIFDPFFSTKAPGKGEGLGLFIIWNILKYMGGSIVLDSNYKNGALFLITIPKGE